MVKLERAFPTSDPSIEEFLRVHYDKPGWLWTIEDDLNRPNLYQFKILNKAGDMVGVTAYQRFSTNLGILQKHVIDSAQRGKGIGLEALALIEEFAKDKGISKLCGYVLEDNTPSLAMMLKAGFKIEGHLRDHFAPGVGCYVVGKLI